LTRRPDLPSNRLAEIAVRVRQLCEKYDLPYTTGSLLVQYGKACGTIAKLSLPTSACPTWPTMRRDPQRKDVRLFRAGLRGTESSSGRRRGSKTAIATVRQRRRRNALRRYGLRALTLADSY
jgi:linoleoyl-CoA desaturase